MLSNGPACFQFAFPNVDPRQFAFGSKVSKKWFIWIPIQTSQGVSAIYFETTVSSRILICGIHLPKRVNETFHLPRLDVLTDAERMTWLHGQNAPRKTRMTEFERRPVPGGAIHEAICFLFRRRVLHLF